jgi:hypothetical protein
LPAKKKAESSKVNLKLRQKRLKEGRCPNCDIHLFEEKDAATDMVHGWRCSHCMELYPERSVPKRFPIPLREKNTVELSCSVKAGTAEDIATNLEFPIKKVKRYLSQVVKEGRLEQKAEGYYRTRIGGL